MKFLDRAKIYIRSGNGGHGCLSFRRERFIEFGGPDGGNGGNGGSVYVEAVNNLNTLIDYRYQQHFKAKNGRGGMGVQRTGAAGASITLKLPMGTQIFSEEGILLADLVKLGEKVCLLSGGRGGRGNHSFKSASNRAPRQFEEGTPGQEMWIWLQLKIIADIGLLGLPNAGKSTLLSTLTRARPKVGDYPFTTLHPHLGMLRRDDTDIVIADIPGLIEGAHEGAGLGDKFLAHVERCPMLLHLIDSSSENIIHDYQVITQELAEYGHGLIDKPRWIVLTKQELISPQEKEDKIQQLRTVTDSPIYSLSALAHQNLDEFIDALIQEADSLRREKATPLSTPPFLNPITPSD